MAVSEVNRLLFEAEAITSSGAVCRGYKLGGLPVAESTWDLSLHPHGQPAIISDRNPGRLIVEFVCDGRVGRGDTASWSLSFAIFDEGELNAGAYAFPEMTIGGGAN